MDLNPHSKGSMNWFILLWIKRGSSRGDVDRKLLKAEDCIEVLMASSQFCICRDKSVWKYEYKVLVLENVVCCEFGRGAPPPYNPPSVAFGLHQGHDPRLALMVAAADNRQNLVMSLETTTGQRSFSMTPPLSHAKHPNIWSVWEVIMKQYQTWNNMTSHC